MCVCVIFLSFPFFLLLSVMFFFSLHFSPLFLFSFFFCFCFQLINLFIINVFVVVAVVVLHAKRTRIAHSHANVHTKLYSFRFDCKIVSLTAAKTNRIFSVSVVLEWRIKIWNYISMSRYENRNGFFLNTFFLTLNWQMVDLNCKMKWNFKKIVWHKLKNIRLRFFHQEFLNQDFSQNFVNFHIIHESNHVFRVKSRRSTK